MRFVVIFLLIFCFGAHCGANTPRNGGVYITDSGHKFYWDHFPIQVHIDSSLSLAIKQQIYLAVGHWNGIVGAEVFQALDIPNASPEIPIFEATSISQKELGRNSRGQEIRGLASVYSEHSGRIRSAVMWLDLDLEISHVRMTTIHELGHALALRHDGDPRSRMYRSTVFGQVFMREDIDHVRNMMR